jgi:hypothetical protein
MNTKKTKVINAIRAAVLETNIPAMTPEAQAKARQTLAELKGDTPEVTEEDLVSEQRERGVRHGAAIIKAYIRMTKDDKEDALCDLLSDLAHWCDREGVSFANELERAKNYYESPEEGGGTQFEDIEILGGTQ